MTDSTKRKLAGLFILLTLGAWLYSSLSHYPGVVESDTLGQYRYMLRGVYSNWKPALYEFQLFVGESLWPGHGTDLAYVAQVVVLGCSVAWIIWHYAKRHPLYALAALGLPLFLSCKVLGLNYIVNDYMAAGCYTLYIAAVLAASERERGHLRNGFIVLAAAALFYGLILRHNSVFMVILLAYWGIGKFCDIGGAKRFFSAIGLVAAFFLASHCINTYCLKCVPSYPLRSVFASDIINISILGNKWEPYCERHCKTENHIPSQTVFRPEAGHMNPIVCGTRQEEDLDERRTNYLNIRDGWIESVSAHPKRYVFIKLFLFHQYLLGGRSIPLGCDIMHHYYPHVEIATEAESHNTRYWISIQFLTIAAIPLLSYFIFIVFCCRTFFRRKHHPIAVLPEERKDALCIIGASMLYTLSFLPFVLSVTEFRYYSIRATLTYVGLSILVISMFVDWLKKRPSRNTGC